MLTTSYRSHHSDLKHYLSEENYIAFCKNICCINTDQEKWSLFTGSSKVNFKAMLLYIGNKILWIPKVHAADKKETFENMKLVLEKDPIWTIYMEYLWWFKGHCLIDWFANVSHVPLGNIKKIYSSPFHIELRVMKMILAWYDHIHSSDYF